MKLESKKKNEEKCAPNKLDHAAMFLALPLDVILIAPPCGVGETKRTAGGGETEEEEEEEEEGVAGSFFLFLRIFVFISTAKPSRR